MFIDSKFFDSNVTQRELRTRCATYRQTVSGKIFESNMMQVANAMRCVIIRRLVASLLMGILLIVGQRNASCERDALHYQGTFDGKFY